MTTLPPIFSACSIFSAEADPTNGFVKYVDQSTASNSGLIDTTPDSVYIGVDHENVTPGGRPSVRITSKKSYNAGLIILDLAHMPASTCGTWPAFWMVGPDWPRSGEIDIIEGVNDQLANSMALHTGSGCAITNTNAFSGEISTPNCDVAAADQAENAGCVIRTTDTATYGDGFNAQEGGVYATEWTNRAISIFFFPRGSVPSDITGGSPDPSSWGKPLAQFQGGCDFASSFRDQQIVFDTTFCNDWAGSVWSNGSCVSRADTCNAFVQDNHSAFEDSYWTVKSLKVFRAESDAALLNNSNIIEATSVISSVSDIATTFTTSAPAPVSPLSSLTFFWPRPSNDTTTAASLASETSTSPRLPLVTVTASIYTIVSDTLQTCVREPVPAEIAADTTVIQALRRPTNTAPAETSVPAPVLPMSATRPTVTVSTPPWSFFPDHGDRLENPPGRKGLRGG